MHVQAALKSEEKIKVSHPLDASCLVYQRGRTSVSASHVEIRASHMAAQRTGLAGGMETVKEEYRGSTSQTLLPLFSVKVHKPGPVCTGWGSYSSPDVAI